MQKEKKKNFIKFLAAIFFIAGFLAVGVKVQAATGDILFECKFDGTGSTPGQIVETCAGASAGTLESATIENTGGWDNGAYINHYHDGEGETYDPWTINFDDKTEVTIEWYEKYSIAQSAASGWNCKGTRAYTTANQGNDYIGAVMSRWGTGWNVGVFATFQTEINPDVVGSVADYGSYCHTSLGNNLYSCGGQERGDLAVFPVSGWAWGTEWRKIRAWYKMPSSVSAADGESMVWWNDVLVYHITNMRGDSDYAVYSSDPDNWSNYITHITVHPSDDYQSGSGPTFYHGYDDIILYEGYVPPGGADIIAPANPSGLSVI